MLFSITSLNHICTANTSCGLKKKEKEETKSCASEEPQFTQTQGTNCSSIFHKDQELKIIQVLPIHSII